MAASILGLVLTLVGCDDAACDASALQAALDRAVPGEVVEVGACTVVADLSVPSGVTLRGVDPARSTVQAASSVAVTLAGDGRVESLRVESDACAAIIVRGGAEVALTDLEVEVSRGIGIGAEDLRRFEMRDVRVRGPIRPGVSPAAIPLPPYRCDTADPATHGIVAVRVTDAAWTQVVSRGFAAFGALMVDSSTTWTGGSSSDHIGVGVEVFGGDATLSELELCGARQDIAPVESFNGIFAGGADIETRGLRVCDGEVYGLFHEGGRGAHTDLVAESNGFTGVWAQDATSLSLSGTGTQLRDNAFAGVAAFRTARVDVADTTIEATREGVTTDGPVGIIRAADGLHLVEVPTVDLARVDLLDNDRVGLLVDLSGASTDSVTVDAVRVRGLGGELGALAQNGTVNPGWDDRITREGDTAANDAAFTGTLDIAGVVGPSCLPPTDSVRTGGLDSFFP